MPRFPVNFRRKSTAADDQNGSIAEPSFRVLERPGSNSVNNAKAFDGPGRLSKLPSEIYNTNLHDLAMEDNLFAGLNSSRGSGSSSNTKTTSDNSSRHSNVSNPPSSAEYNPVQEDWRNAAIRKPLPPIDHGIPPVPPVHKNSNFLKQAGRTFSFGSNKKNSLTPISSEEPAPPLPEYKTPSVRSRATTNSTVTSPVPPKLEDDDFKLDLGGELSTMLNRFDKRSSAMTLKEREAGNSRPSQPSPLHFDHAAQVQPPPKSLNSHHSHEGLLISEKTKLLSTHTDSLTHKPSAATSSSSNRSPDGRASQDDDEDTTLLSDSIAASQFLSNSSTSRELTGRQKRDTGRQPTSHLGLTETYAKTTRYTADQDDDNLFAKSLGRPPRVAPRIGGRSNTAPQSNKVMTPQEFEKYRQHRVQEERLEKANNNGSDKEDEDINYDDEDEDEMEKSRQLAKQRRKQEAHLSVYRQQMMKVTGESANPPPRPSMTMSLSTPNLPLANGGKNGHTPTPPSDGSEDEEVPLAILAAHGFPNKNRPPARLSTMGSNPNLRASMLPSATVGGSSVAGEGAVGGASGGRLPPFARKLPQDPYLGAGLINQPPRESMALSGGAPAQSRPIPTGGLVGVIAHEERARALRRGSPAIDNAKNSISQLQMNPAFDPINGIPSQMMYPMGPPAMQPPMLSAGDQAQLQMNQQMQQFMQMQMQFMQMMATQNAGQGQVPHAPMGHMPTQSIGSVGDMSRNSFLGGDMARNSMMGGDIPRASFMGPPVTSGMAPSLGLDLPYGGPQTRTMSMVQPSSSSWVQPPPQPNYLPSIHVQGGGYAPSIAPSERSNVGLPGRYRPVSSAYNNEPSGRTSTMGAYASHMHSKLQVESKAPAQHKDDDDDDDEGWAAMKAKRDQKKSLWRSKKTFGSDIGALIN